MVTQELLNFIREQQRNGISDSDIHNSLLKSNWSEQDLKQAFEHVKSGVPVLPQPMSGASSEQSTHLFITIAGLFLFFPLGVVFMWMWMQWPKWVKLVITIVPIVLWLSYIVFLLSFFIFFATHPVPSTNQTTYQSPLKTSVTTVPPSPGNFGTAYSQAQNVHRNNDVMVILNAVEIYNTNNPTKPLSLPSSPTEIGNQTSQIDLCASLLPKILDALPVDPSLGKNIQPDSCQKPYHTGYTINQVAGKIQVSAPYAENGEAISVVR